METLDYEIHISAPIQKVWDLLWSPETYPIWTQFFTPGSQMKSDWKVGGKTYFTNQKGEGMVSTIESLDEPNEVIFRHLGTVRDGVEDTYTREVKDWSGAEEKYFLRAIDENTTQLTATVHVSNENEDAMNKGFNEGFAMLKKLAEKE